MGFGPEREASSGAGLTLPLWLGCCEGRKGCAKLMEIPTPMELAFFLKLEGKRLLSVMGSQNQRGTEASGKVRALNYPHSENLGKGRAASSSHVWPAGDWYHTLSSALEVHPAQSHQRGARLLPGQCLLSIQRAVPGETSFTGSQARPSGRVQAVEGTAVGGFKVRQKRQGAGFGKVLSYFQIANPHGHHSVLQGLPDTTPSGPPHRPSSIRDQEQDWVLLSLFSLPGGFYPLP